MAYLLKILPDSLKTQLAKFMYKDAIYMHKFLQDRDENFYAKYLEELQSEKLSKGTFISKVGTPPDFVFFIVHGIVLN